MQKYVETAAQGMEKASVSNQASAQVLDANRRIMEELEERMQDFVSCQKKTYQTMEQVRRLLADVAVAGENNNIYLSSGRTAQTTAGKENMEVRRLLKEQGERQEALLEEMNKTMKELSKGSQKGRFGIFR